MRGGRVRRRRTKSRKACSSTFRVKDLQLFKRYKRAFSIIVQEASTGEVGVLQDDLVPRPVVLVDGDHLVAAGDILLFSREVGDADQLTNEVMLEVQVSGVLVAEVERAQPMDQLLAAVWLLQMLHQHDQVGDVQLLLEELQQVAVAPQVATWRAGGVVALVSGSGGAVQPAGGHGGAKGVE